jgi:hypothetical protein
MNKTIDSKPELAKQTLVKLPTLGIRRRRLSILYRPVKVASLP